jgi:hypothetical protein
MSAQPPRAPGTGPVVGQPLTAAPPAQQSWQAQARLWYDDALWEYHQRLAAGQSVACTTWRLFIEEIKDFESIDPVSSGITLNSVDIH